MRLIQYVMSSITHGVSVWTQVLWLRVQQNAWLLQCVEVDVVVCEESSIGFLMLFSQKI